ncbi:MAG: UDP-N-acetylglucosamine pyrophosphorylase [Clostridium sp.]|uniref:UDP-N-acetylglucosamine pyrophosphorylase n=1 Tax=Clostridium sp. TaxID=1506 RepID=UPI0025C732EA|nr:UDP-N-acetylglucosamine pyrophosphorylase [Clostridium sp.]MCE5222214.1 UDP-N-acetylglucosamine pyrophosphorylase [Clostridium sp.]
MKLELTVRELGEALKKIEEKFKLDILIKSTLSGGWMTITGEAIILKTLSDIKIGCGGKSDNIIDIKIKTEDNQEGIIVKLTGAKNKMFNVDISSTRYKELRSNNLTINKIKINENESKLRIDEDIIFTIQASVDEVAKIIKG